MYCVNRCDLFHIMGEVKDLLNSYADVDELYSLLQGKDAIIVQI